MVREPLTGAEQARHAREIEKIRRRLFRRYQPNDYCIIQNSEQVLAASAESCWNAACGNYRVFRFGGISFLVDCADDGPSKLSIAHKEDDQFSFWLTGPRGHTVNSIIVRFRQLDEVVHAYVQSYRRANLARGEQQQGGPIDF